MTPMNRRAFARAMLAAGLTAAGVRVRAENAPDVLRIGYQKSSTRSSRPDCCRRESTRVRRSAGTSTRNARFRSARENPSHEGAIFLSL